jgi:DNA polymerase bacteriophage-type
MTLTFGRLKLRRDESWLRILLPSGRALCYPSPRIDEDNRLSYMGVNNYSRKWERIPTYGGKFAAEVTQGTARDVIADAMPRAEGAGYEIVLTVHDEIVTEVPDDERFSGSGLANILTTNPAWTDGLPLAATSFEGKRYGKE